MNTRTKLTLFVTLVGLSFLFSNFTRFKSIEEFPPMSADELTQYLHGGTSKEWRATSFALLGILNTQKCRLDDRITLNADGTFQYDGGSKLCGREDNKKRRTGKWFVTDSGKKLVFEYDRGRRKTKIDRHEGEVINAGGGWIVLSGRYKGISLQGTYFAQ